MTLAKLFFFSAAPLKLNPVGGTGWVTHREYRREGPYFVLSFLLFLFGVLRGVSKSICLKPVHVIKVKRKRAMESVKSSSMLNWFITLRERVKSF